MEKTQKAVAIHGTRVSGKTVAGQKQRQEQKGRPISKGELEKEILTFIRSHPHALTTEIMDAMKVEPMFLFEVLDNMKERHILRSKTVEPPSDL